MSATTFATTKKSVHYWVGRGTLCSMDNNVRQQANHTTDKDAVSCPYCQFQLRLNAEAQS